jgi:gamma-glutamyl hercynylcysteine S-oxide hydrolase
LVAGRLRAGAHPPDALAGVIGALEEHGVGGRFNFLLTDGEEIAATAAGDTLCYRLGPDSLVVASEPGDDEPGWAEVPDRSVLMASPAGIAVSPLPGPAT